MRSCSNEQDWLLAFDLETKHEQQKTLFVSSSLPCCHCLAGPGKTVLDHQGFAESPASVLTPVCFGCIYCARSHANAQSEITEHSSASAIEVYIKDTTALLLCEYWYILMYTTRSQGQCAEGV